MLERAAGCVETAGRRFLRDPNGAIRTRSALPRHFWKHNGFAGDVAHWLRALVQPRGQTRSIHNPPYEATSANDGSLPFLDFLYPQEIRDNAALPLSRHSKRLVSRRRKRSLASFSRAYTSNASHIRPAHLEESDNHPSHMPESIDVRKQAIEDLTKLMDQRGVDYDRAWVLYLAAGSLSDSQSDIRSALCAYLSKSQKPADQDRAWEVFEAISPETRSANDFLAITRSQLGSNDPSKLKSICEQAIDMGYADSCCALAFSYHVKRNNWRGALEIWDLRLRPGEESNRPQPQIFLSELKDSMIPENALSLGSFLESEPNHVNALELARFLLDQISTSLHVLENTSIGVLLQILQRYHDMGLLERIHYLDVIKTLQDSNQRQTFAWSIVIYRQFRSQMPAIKPPKSLLARQVDCLVTFDMASAIPFFVDQMAHFYQKPSPEVYKQAMIAFSRMGDVAKVNFFLDKLVVDHGKPKSRRFLNPLLFVHARNGNVQETINQFQRISKEFHLEPSVASWNILLVAYAVSKDAAGALATFKRMRENGVSPDSYTFAKLMNICAKRGDIVSVRQLLKEAQANHVQVTMQMLEKIVQVYANIGLLNLAEDFAMACLSSNVKGSPMRMLNGLLMQYALRIDTQSFDRVMRQMESNGICPDATTHAAGMLRLALVGKPDQARLTLRRLHKKRVLHASEYHFAIVLWGYVRTRNLAMVDVISREITRRFGTSGLTSSFLELKSQVQQDLETLKKDSTMESTDSRLLDAEKRLLESITTHRVVTAKPDSPQTIAGEHKFGKALPAPHYAYLIKAYGARGATEEARTLFQEYIDNNHSSGSPVDEDKPVPIRLVTEMMHVHLKAGQYQQVEECWQRVLPTALKMASRIDVGDLFGSHQPPENAPFASKPLLQPHLAPDERLTGSQDNTVDLELDAPQQKKPEIIPSQQFLLSRPFSIYLRALAYQNDTERIFKAVAEFRDIGFALSTFNLSTLVQMLASSDKYADLLEAFRIFEVEFMPHWPGWTRLERGSGLKPPGVPRGVAALDDPRTKRSSQQFLGKHARKHWSAIAPGFMQPTYVSMVYLAAALNRVRATSIVNGSHELANLFDVAPNTIEELGKLRYLREKFQGVLIRFRSHQPEKERQRRPVRHAVTPGGILGTGRRAGRRPSIREEEFHENEDKLPSLDEDSEWHDRLQRDDLDLGVLDSPLTPEDRMDLEHELTRYHRQRREMSHRREKRRRPKKTKHREIANEAEESLELENHSEAHVDSKAEHEAAF